MQHSSDEQKQTNTGVDLEQRLVAYYGPRLREQPLPQDAWQQLRHKLKQPIKHHIRVRRPIRNMKRYRAHIAPNPVPEYIDTAFNRVAYDAHVSYPSSLLHCTFKRKLWAPAVRVSSLRKQPIRLLLPVDTERSLPTSGLTVLLATGVARYQLVKKALLIYLLLTGFVVIGVCAAFFYALHHQPLTDLLIVVIGGPGLLFLLNRQKRQVCYAADALVVLWIGRGRMCEGLHVLAGPTRSSHRSGWGEPSLAERIARVCGTRVESGNERLTMVR